MKKFLFALAAAAFFAAPFFSLEVPQLESPVMDLAGIMTQKGRADLQEYLLAIDQNSAAQIAVLTIPSHYNILLMDNSNLHLLHFEFLCHQFLSLFHYLI